MALPRSFEGPKDDDLLSKLPEELIQHILSFLGMKDAVRTSILSKQWEYLWKSLPNLRFDLYSDEDVDFVDRALFFLRESKVRKFSLQCCTDFFDVELPLRRWITALLRRNVEELHLDFLECEYLFKFELLYCLFASASLASLSLVMCWDFTFPPLVRLSNLKHLFLQPVYFYDAESVDNLFTGCPMLETMSLLQSTFYCNVRIYAPKLYKLAIHEEIDEEDYGYDVIISGPSLKSLYLKSEFISPYHLHDLPSLDEAIIHMDNSLEDRAYWSQFVSCLDTVLKGISHVNKLSFSCGVVQALNYHIDVLAKVPLFNNLSVLSFTDLEPIQLDDQIGLMKILQNSPYLETLRFERGIILPAHCKERGKILHPVPPCFVSRLRTLEINFNNNEEYHKLFMKAAKILLEKATVLEKLILYSRKYQRVETRERENLIKGLKELPRASKVCWFEFADSEMKSI